MSLSDNVSELASLLLKSAPESLSWHFNNTMNDTELTDTVYRFLHPGLREVYRDFKFPEIEVLKTYSELESVHFTRHFLAERAEKYGTSETLSADMVFSLLRVARDTDNLPLFEHAISVLDIVAAQWNVNWYSRFSQFYLKHEKIPEAIALYVKTADKFPRHIGIRAALAGAYEMNSQTIESAKTYEKAIHLARAQSSERIDELADKLAILKRDKLDN